MKIKDSIQLEEFYKTNKRIIKKLNILKKKF